MLDGRPGHEKQTLGVIQALQKSVDVRVTLFPVKSVSFFNILAHQSEIKDSDLLIGTGRRTHLLMLLYKKRYGVPAVTCMTPALYLRFGFDLCFVPEHDGINEQGNIVLTLGSPNCSHNKRNHRQDSGLILLGGADPKSHTWNSQDVADMVEKILYSDSQKIWTISSSPRTPQDTIDLVKRLSDQRGSITFFDYKDTPPGWIEEQYDRNSVVWVTSDSISMIYEALTAGCKVGVLPMQWIRKNSKFKRNEDVLLAKGLVKSFASWEQGDLTWPEDNELNEAQCCAKWILNKWWPENLR